LPNLAYLCPEIKTGTMNTLKAEYQLTYDTEVLLENTLGGHAKLTLQSTATLNHYTFTIKKAKHQELFFVSVLGPQDQYFYVGLIDDHKNFKLTKASKYKEESVVYKTFRFFWVNLEKRNVPNLRKLNIFHMGMCNRCGRELSDPLSIQMGLGPFCRKQHYK
jgi:hypothetical protein